MERLSAHLMWCGVVITVSGQIAYAAVVIYGPPGSSAVVVPALLALTGPLTAITGFFLGRGSRSLANGTNGPASPPSPPTRSSSSPPS